MFKDKRPHLYRLIVNPDNTFEISIDYKVVNHGTLLDDFNPAVNPPAEIDDPNDFKPEDWDEREKIPGTAVSRHLMAFWRYAGNLETASKCSVSMHSYATFFRSS